MKANNSDVDERAVNLAIARLKREIKIRGHIDDYISGYRAAIYDFLWDYVGRYRTELWAKCILEMHKIQRMLDQNYLEKK